MAKETDISAKELTAIKKLLVLMLANQGLTQTQIASALEVDRTSLSRMFPKGMLASIAKGAEVDE